ARADGHLRELGLNRVFVALMETPIASGVQRTADACLAAAASPDDVTYVGLMLGRPTDALRLCIRGLLPDQLPGFLSRIGWSGPRDAAAAALLPFALLADRFSLAVDVGERVGPRLGLECRLDQDAAAAWEPFLDALVACGTCTAAKRDAVLGWT